jgi:hypothetical protein
MVLINAAKGPIHYGLMKADNKRMVPVAVTTDGKIFRLEKQPNKKPPNDESQKKKVKGQRKKDKGQKKGLSKDIEQKLTWRDYRLRCIHCKMYMSDLGRVNHLKSCIRVPPGKLRECMMQWFAEFLTANGSKLSLTRWVKMLKLVGIVEANSDLEHECMLEFLKDYNRAKPEVIDELDTKLILLGDLVHNLNKTALQLAVPHKRMPFHVDYKGESSNLAQAQALLKARSDLEKKLALKLANYQKKLDKERETFLESFWPLWFKAVDKMEEDRRSAGGELCEDMGNLDPFIVTEESLNWRPTTGNAKRPHDGGKLPAKKRPKLLLASTINDGASTSRVIQPSVDSMSEVDEGSKSANGKRLTNKRKKGKKLVVKGRQQKNRVRPIYSSSSEDEQTMAKELSPKDLSDSNVGKETPLKSVQGIFCIRCSVCPLCWF